MSRTGTEYLDAHPHAPLTSSDVHVREDPEEEEEEEEKKDEGNREEWDDDGDEDNGYSV